MCALLCFPTVLLSNWLWHCGHPQPPTAEVAVPLATSPGLARSLKGQALSQGRENYCSDVTRSISYCQTLTTGCQIVLFGPFSIQTGARRAAAQSDRWQGWSSALSSMLHLLLSPGLAPLIMSLGSVVPPSLWLSASLSHTWVSHVRFWDCGDETDFACTSATSPPRCLAVLWDL